MPNSRRDRGDSDGLYSISLLDWCMHCRTPDAEQHDGIAAVALFASHPCLISRLFFGLNADFLKWVVKPNTGFCFLHQQLCGSWYFRLGDHKLPEACPNYELMRHSEQAYCELQVCPAWSLQKPVEQLSALMHCAAGLHGHGKDHVNWISDVVVV